MRSSSAAVTRATIAGVVSRQTRPIGLPPAPRSRRPLACPISSSMMREGMAASSTLSSRCRVGGIDRIAAQHRELVCGANHAMLQGPTDRLGGDPPARAALDP